MGRKCDPVYYGADCSLKKCKYGVDPLYYDSTDGAIHQTAVVHLGSVGGCTAAACSTANTRMPAAISGTFKIVFYDVFGEKYVTKDISAANSLTPLAVRDALEALPNGVIANDNTDVTGLAPAACTVAMQSKTGDITTSGGIGAGEAGSATAGGAGRGAGLGTMGHTSSGANTATGVGSGPEFTVTFTTNPGILKSIEVDTENILNTGVADYWVANSRQGQFHSRYSTNLGRVNTLQYGSTKLYTNTDLTGSVVGAATDASLVKVGGQEFRVTAENAAFLTLSEPFLGTSIGATLTATGAELGSSHTYTDHGTLTGAAVTEFDGATSTFTTDKNFPAAAFGGTWFKFSGDENIGSVGGVAQTTCQGKMLDGTATTIVLAPGHTCVHTASITTGTAKIADGHFVAKTATKAAEISVVGVDTEIVVQHLQEGAALSVGGCSFTVSKRGVTGAATNLDIALYGHTLGAGGGALGVDNNFDCNPQNGKGATQGAAAPSVFYGEFGTPGTPVYRRTDDPNNQNIYKAPSDTGSAIASNLMLTRGNAAAYLVETSAEGTVTAVIATQDGGSTVDQAFTAAANVDVAVNEPFFVNGRGPMENLAAVSAATSITVKNPATGFGKFFPHRLAAVAAIKWPISLAIAADADRTGSTAVVAGSVLLLDGRRYRVKARDADAGGINGRSKVTLSENYAGGSLEKVCTSCIAVTTKVDGGMKTFGASGGAGALLNLQVGDRVLEEGMVHGDALTTVDTRTSGTTFVNSLGGSHGTVSHLSGTDVTGATDQSGGKSLYKTRYGALGAPGVTVITETATGANTYNYVAQCANRGTCDGATGICKCFKGYAGDNCAKQNMLAM
jgi:hypothetical protein